MTDTNDVLGHFEIAVRQRMVSPGPCPLYPELFFSMDMHRGKLILNFASIEAATVRALVTYRKEEADGEDVVFSIRYTVAQPFRQRKLATSIVEQSLEEMRQTFQGVLKRFYVKATVGKSNLGGQKVARKTLSAIASPVADTTIGEDDLQYVRAFLLD